MKKRKPEGISHEAWDSVDSPPLGEAILARMAPARRGRGPQVKPTKEAVSVRLDRDVVEHFRRSGPGWQSRLNEALRKSVFG